MDALQEGLGRYRCHQADGAADMAQAGAELFSYLEDVIAPRPCSPSRYSTLAMVVRNNDPEDLEDIKQILLETGGSGDGVKKVLGAIDERIALLRETEPDERGNRPLARLDLDGDAHAVSLDELPDAL